MEQKKAIKNNGADWYFFDADKKVLGRIAQEISVLLQGKNRVDYVANVVPPVFVVVTNTDTVAVTGKKEEAKMYRHYTGHPGGLRERSLAEQRSRDSRVIIENAVYGMLPKNKLRDVRMKHLKLYKGADHPHEAQDKKEEKVKD
jgi:large subunit ribosomal protein L13